MDQTKQEIRTESERPKQNFARPKRMEWIRRTNRRLKLLRCGMAVLCGMVLVMGALLLILPSLKVREIVVEGDLVTTTQEEIIAASGIEIGTEVIGTDWSVAANNIEKQCPVKVQLTVTPFKIKIHVTELETARMKYGDLWVSLDADFKVMDISENEADFEGLLLLELPDIAGINEGEPLQFSDGAVDLSYVKKAIEFLDSKELDSRVDLLDASEKFQVSCVLDGSYRVIFGKVGDLDAKLEIANEIIALKNGIDSYAVIDVSDVKRSTYRPVVDSEFLMAD